MATDCDVCVIGGGPAGLAAAEAASAAGARVLLAEQKPSLGRKFLMAGKSGLNLTRDEPGAVFRAAYRPGDPRLTAALGADPPAAVRDWAAGLGQPVFTGSSGRVFPRAMKASPLLRAWISRLAAAGVEMRTRTRWTGWRGDDPVFAAPDGTLAVRAGAVVLALGGASWSRLGADGAWVDRLAPLMPVSAFGPSNVGFALAWSPHMARFAGTPVKGVALGAGGMRIRGEFVVTARGVEGSAIYALNPALLARDGGRGAILTLDLAPDRDAAALAGRIGAARRGESLANILRKRAGLSPVKAALLREAGPVPRAPREMAARIKAAPLTLAGPHPIDEAISTTGGAALSALDRDLMLPARPGLFLAGEMLDWDAPTGGYLITACLGTGRLAGGAAAAFAVQSRAGPARA